MRRRRGRGKWEGPEGSVVHGGEVCYRCSDEGILDWEERSWGQVVQHLFHRSWLAMWPWWM